MSAEIHTEQRLLQRKKISAVGSDTEPSAMESTLRFLILLEPYRDLYMNYTVCWSLHAVYQQHQLAVSAHSASLS